MKSQIIRSLLFGSFLFTVACGGCWSEGGTLPPWQNGLHLNGGSPLAQGSSADGISANGLHLNGITLDSVMFEKLRVDGSQLSAYSPAAGRTLTGAELVGATLEVTSGAPGAGVSYQLRIDGVERDTSAATSDVHLYWMSYRRPGDAAWRSVCTASVCTDDSCAPEPAIPIADLQWDPATGRHREAPGKLTLACKSGAIGSCASWGYRPWIPGLVQHHQACIFMKRADYCGDGHGYTVNGTWIDIYDHLSPAIQTPTTGWPLEARWGTQGASCVSSRRHPEIPFSGQCLRDGMLVTLPACGDAPGSGDLLGNGAHPRVQR